MKALVLVVAVAGAAALLGCGCASFHAEPPKPLTVREIVEMSTNGVPAEAIIARMKAAGTVYRLKASELGQLQRDGVPAAVVDYMQETYLGAVRLDAMYEERRRWILHHGHWFGEPDEFYMFRGRAWRNCK